jgi:PadR family transcriptional regulator PadR
METHFPFDPSLVKLQRNYLKNHTLSACLLTLASQGVMWQASYVFKGERQHVEKTRLELVRGTLDVLILKSLVWGPLHGYAITSLIRRQSDEALLVEEGTLYPALWRMESRGFVEAEWGLSDNNRKAKYYKLTSEGRRYLRAETKTWEAYAEAVAKILSATAPPTPKTT